MQSTTHDRLELRRDGAVPGADRPEGGHANLTDDLELVLSVEVRPEREHLPEHDREGIEVGPRVHGRPSTMFGRHVAELSLDVAVLGLVQASVRLGDPEVDELHGSVAADQDVGRTDVAMHDVEGAALEAGGFVGRSEPVEGLVGDAHGYVDVDEGAGEERGVHESAESHPIDVLHDHEVLVAVLFEGVHRDDVGMVDAAEDPGLVEEHLDVALHGGAVLVDLLDGHATPAGEGLGQVELSHAAGAELLDDPVGADGAGDGGGHRHHSKPPPPSDATAVPTGKGRDFRANPHDSARAR